MECQQCKKELTDLLALFTKYQICSKCVKNNHKKVVNK